MENDCAGEGQPSLDHLQPLHDRMAQYIPPECLYGVRDKLSTHDWKPFKKPGDIFCLSQVLWEIANGHVPHEGSSWEDIVKKIKDGSDKSDPFPCDVETNPRDTKKYND